DPLGNEREAADLRAHVRLEEAGFDMVASQGASPDGEGAFTDASDWAEPSQVEDWERPNTFAADAEEELPEKPAPRSMNHLLYGGVEENSGGSVIPSIQEQLKRMRALPTPIAEDAETPPAPLPMDEDKPDEALAPTPAEPAASGDDWDDW